MEFTIYSIGSAVYLEEILNAVAMISGSGDIESLAKIGLLAGVLILGFQALFNGTAIQFQKLLVCMVLYLAMYGPSGRALIEDVYTGDVAVVDNVPLGPLAVGSIVSQIGYNVTHIFEQSFSTPSMTNYGFADPLNTLVQVRLTAKNVFNIGAMAGSGNKSLLASWANYMRECTLTGANSDERVIRDVLYNKNAIEGLRFDSNVYYTKIYDGSADGVTLSCTDAYAALTADTGMAEDALLDDLSKRWARPGATYTGADLEARLNDSLIAIAGGAADARQFAVTAALLPILEGAPGQRAIEDLQGAAAIMMSQAAQQQATQWAAEGSMFTKYIRPFMTFFEGFIYAITPLMAFVIVLGGFGISLVSKYLMLLIWMILWMPVLSVVNLYTISTTRAKIETLLGASSFGMDGISFADMREMLPIIEAQVGVAGMMASAVPALCMFLVYGTSVAASGIASKLGGSDTINEKISSPDVISPGAGVAMSSQVSHDPTRGGRQTGYDEMVGSLVSGSTLSSSVQSMSSKAQADQQSFGSQLSAASQQSYGDGISKQDAAKIGAGIRGTAAFQNSASMQEAYKETLAKSNSQEEADAIIGASAVSANIKGSAGVGGSGGPSASVGAGGTVTRTKQDGNSTKDAASTGTSEDNTSTLQKNFSGALARDKSFSLDQAFAENSSLSKMVTNSDSLTKSAQQSVTSTNAFQQAETALQSYGINTNTNGLAVAQQMQQNGGLEKLQNTLDYTTDKDGNSLSTRMQDDQKTLSHGLSGETAYVAAGLKALSETGNLDKLFESGFNANSNSGIQAPNVGNLEGDFSDRRNENAGTMDQQERRLNSERAGAVATGGDAAAGVYTHGSDIATGRKAGFDEQVKAGASGHARNELGQVGSGAKEIDGFRMAGMANNAWETYVGKDRGERSEDYNRDVSYGTSQGLSQPQAEFYAGSRMGDLETSDTQAFEAKMAQDHGYTPEEAAGVRIKLEQAAMSDAPAAYMGSVSTANGGDNHLLITQGNDGTDQAGPSNGSNTVYGQAMRDSAILSTKD